MKRLKIEKIEKKKKFDRPTRFYRLRLRLRIGGICAMRRQDFFDESSVFLGVEYNGQGPVAVSFWKSEI